MAISKVRPELDQDQKTTKGSGVYNIADPGQQTSEVPNMQVDVLQAFFTFLITSDLFHFCQQLISNYCFLRPTCWYPLPLNKAKTFSRRKKG